MKVKIIVTYGIAFLLLIGFIVLFSQIFEGASQPVTPTESFNEALWSTWGATIVVVSFVIFAGGAGILVLLGGGWRWE
jgi:hypothetical protein